jgi:hypothetical protein
MSQQRRRGDAAQEARLQRSGGRDRNSSRVSGGGNGAGGTPHKKQGCSAAKGAETATERV